MFFTSSAKLGKALLESHSTFSRNEAETEVEMEVDGDSILRMIAENDAEIG